MINRRLVDIFQLHNLNISLKTYIVELSSTNILSDHLCICDISIQKYCHSCFYYSTNSEKKFLSVQQIKWLKIGSA